MGEGTSSKLGSVAKIIDSLTVNQIANAAGKFGETFIEGLTELAKIGIISPETYLKEINNLSVKKEFGSWRGPLKEIKITTGDGSEEK